MLIVVEVSKKYNLLLKKAVSILKNKTKKSKAEAVKLLNKATESIYYFVSNV